jgi:hypothetical protein
MNGVPEGIVGIITNHSWLDNPTFRGMRQSLMRSFEQIYVLDLHGNAKKRERAPDGSKDENVFDIEQGVSISLFVKNPNQPKGIFHSEVWGSRQSKYSATARSELRAVPWRELKPDAPYYFLVPLQMGGSSEYRRYTPLQEIFAENVTGIVTARDGLVVGFLKSDLQERVEGFLNRATADDEIRRRYRVGDNYQWKMRVVREAMAGELFQEALIKNYTFGPFDERLLYNDPRLVFRPRTAVMRHLTDGENIGLITTRITKDEDTVFVTRHPIAHKSASAYDISYVFHCVLPRTMIVRISHPISAVSSNRATNIISHPRKSSATSMRCCTHRPIAYDTPSFCASTSRASRSPSRPRISRRCPASAGR